jgi:hypothetical protein
MSPIASDGVQQVVASVALIISRESANTVNPLEHLRLIPLSTNWLSNKTHHKKSPMVDQRVAGRIDLKFRKMTGEGAKDGTNTTMIAGSENEAAVQGEIDGIVTTMGDMKIAAGGSGIGVEIGIVMTNEEIEAVTVIAEMIATAGVKPGFHTFLLLRVLYHYVQYNYFLGSEFGLGWRKIDTTYCSR